MTTYRHISLSFDAAGKFHHYEIWTACKRTAFLAHIADFLDIEAAEAFCKEAAG